MAGTPTVSIAPRPFTDHPELSGANPRVPLLPRIASSPAGAPEHRRTDARPAIGSLSAVLHPQLGPAHVCRVLGRKLQNGTEYFLVAFFQPEHSPCFVPSQFLFQLHPQVRRPLDDEAEFRALMERRDLSVDCLLERIFSAGQVLAINHADALFPPDQLAQAAVRPAPKQTQETMFQCVTCAAVLIMGYVASRWRIPPEKLGMVVATLFKTSPSRYISAQAVMSRAQALFTNLLLTNST
jgi:hypothetical protein